MSDDYVRALEDLESLVRQFSCCEGEDCLRSVECRKRLARIEALRAQKTSEVSGHCRGTTGDSEAPPQAASPAGRSEEPGILEPDLEHLGPHARAAWGKEPGSPSGVCPACFGDGTIDSGGEELMCPVCNGSGRR